MLNVTAVTALQKKGREDWKGDLQLCR